MINDLAIYDTTVLPDLILPVTVTENTGKYYLGNRYMQDDLTVSLGYLAKTREEMDTLYAFWKTSCNSGTKHFIISLNVMGINADNGHKLGVKWLGNFVAPNTVGMIYEGKMKLKIEYTVNSLDELVAI